LLHFGCMETTRQNMPLTTKQLLRKRGTRARINGKRPCARISEALAQEIRREYEANGSGPDLALKYGCSVTTIANVIRRTGGEMREATVTRSKRSGNTREQRKCTGCGQFFHLTKENFPPGAGYGFAYRCRPCANRKIQKWTRTGQGLLTACRKIDRRRGTANDLELEFIQAHIVGKPCYYCGSNQSTGVDRKDNTLGYLKSNVLPCCTSCNLLRGDKLSVEQMLDLGALMNQNTNLRGILERRIFTKALSYGLT
jgi:hypothetical protein